MPDEDTVIRIGTAFYREAGFWRRRGSLVLFPDKIAYAGSFVATTNLGGGLLGFLVAGGIANSTATKKIARDHKAVTTIPLADITNVALVRSKRGKTKAFVLTTTAGGQYKFVPTKADEWLADLSRALQDSGRTLSQSETGLTVA